MVLKYCLKTKTVGRIVAQTCWIRVFQIKTIVKKYDETPTQLLQCLEKSHHSEVCRLPERGTMGVTSTVWLIKWSPSYTKGGGPVKCLWNFSVKLCLKQSQPWLPQPNAFCLVKLVWNRSPSTVTIPRENPWHFILCNICFSSVNTWVLQTMEISWCCVIGQLSFSFLVIQRTVTCLTINGIIAFIKHY